MIFKQKYLIILKCVVLILIVLNPILGSSQSAFPYTLDLESGTLPPGVILPTGGGNNNAQFTADGLLLTDSKNQFGAIIIDDVEFDSTNGIEVEIVFSMYKGTKYDGSYGDGFSSFLFDGSEASDIGYRGGGLGYNYNRTRANTSYRGKGLNGAYLGIGFDQFGNFKANRFSDVARTAGYNTATGGNWNGNSYQSHITLRGAQLKGGFSNTNYGLRGDRYSGYPLLYTVTTRSTTNSFGGKSLDVTDGSYIDVPPFTGSDTFELRNGVLTDDPNNLNYRKAFIRLVPAAPQPGYLITIEIQHGNTLTTVVDNYYYPDSLVYVENANSNGIVNASTESAYQGQSTTHTLDCSVPNTFKIGLAGSTGGASQIQVISFLKIKLPFMPELAEDALNHCGNYKSLEFSPFENDIVYNGLVTSPTSGNDSNHIDFSSFLFLDESGNPIGTPTSYTENGVGTWNYDASTGQITFAPDKNFLGEANVYYSVKGLGTNGGPFGQDIYRSEPTKISVNVVRCNGISNPNLYMKSN